MGAAIQGPKSGNQRGGRYSRRPMADINVTPMVDVMLVLLIVFMVTAPLLTVGVPVELPRTEAKQLESETDPLTITIRADGAVYLQETAIDKEEVVARMRAISREGYDRRVFIRADATADYGLVADVMARLSASGFRNLGLVTDTRDRTLAAPASAASSTEDKE